MSDLVERFLVTVAMLLLAVVLSLPVVWFKSSMEAATFNRVTGQDITTWEAVWIELRVDCN